MVNFHSSMLFKLTARGKPRSRILLTFALLLLPLLGCAKYPVPGVLAESVAEYNETIDIHRYVSEEDLPTIVQGIGDHAFRAYGLPPDEYVIELGVNTFDPQDNSRIFVWYLLGGQKAGEGRTLFSTPRIDPAEREPNLPYYIFSILALEDFRQAMLGHGPRSFRVHVDKQTLQIVSPVNKHVE